MSTLGWRTREQNISLSPIKKIYGFMWKNEIKKSAQEFKEFEELNNWLEFDWNLIGKYNVVNGS